MDISTNHKNNKQLRGSTVGQVFCSLPEDIILDILRRIPANQVIHLKKVCKSWRSLISHPTFLDFHLHRSRLTNNIILTTFTKPQAEFEMAFQPAAFQGPDVDIFSVNLQLQIHDMRAEIFPLNYPLPGEVLSVKASCDGLLLLRNQHMRLCVHNPVTATYKLLPDVTVTVKHCNLVRAFYWMYDWTFFYDTRVAKYKVCGFISVSIIHCHGILLTLGDDRWSTFTYEYNTTPPAGGSILLPPVFLDNKLHWLTNHDDHSKQYVLLSMDIPEIKFRTTVVPIEQHGRDHLLSELKGSLCLTSFSCDQLEIFVLEDSDRGRWTKKYSTSLMLLSNWPTFPRSFSSDDVCVVVTRDLDGSDFSGLVKVLIHNGDQLFCYDLKHQESSIIGNLSKDQWLRKTYHFYSGTFVQV